MVMIACSFGETDRGWLSISAEDRWFSKLQHCFLRGLSICPVVAAEYLCYLWREMVNKQLCVWV